MDFLSEILDDHYVYLVEILTIIAILVLLFYFFYALNVFRKD